MKIAEDARNAALNGAAIIPTFGSPTLVMAEHVQTAIIEAAGRVHDRDTRGARALRDTISQYLAQTYDVVADPERELLITHGAMHGLSVTFRALFEPGDEVIVPAPTFFFDESIRSTGAIPVYVDLLEADEWQWDLERIAAKVTPRTRALMLCNPNNPTASVPSRDLVQAVVHWAASKELLVVADEAYARFVFDGDVYTPQMKFRNDYEGLVTVTSLSKNYGFSNWRVGYVHAPEPLLSRIHLQFEWDALDVGPGPQAAARAVIDGPQEWLEKVLATYQPNRDQLMDGLAKIGLSAVRPRGGPFALVNFSSIALRGRELEAGLLARGIAAVAGDGFMGPNTHARIMFGGLTEDVARVIEGLRLLVGDSTKGG